MGFGPRFQGMSSKLDASVKPRDIDLDQWLADTRADEEGNEEAHSPTAVRPG